MAFVGMLQATLLVSALLSSCHAARPRPQAEAAFVPGEVIVKFAEGTPGAVPATRGDRDPMQEPRFTSYVQDLSEELGIPVRSRQVTSGREVVLTIDESQLHESLNDRLSEDRRVRSVRREMAEPRYITEKPVARFVVAIEGDALRTPSARERFKENLERELGFPLEIANVDEQFVLTIDLGALTLQLTAKLEQRPDVDYAQTNALLQPQ